MWAIIKINSKKINLFKQDFNKYFDSNYKFYEPKIKIKYLKRNNINSHKDVSILGNYLFCFHSSLGAPDKVNYIKKFRGLKLFLDGHIQCQKEIVNFIKRCKDNEDKEGYLLQNFFIKEINRSYEFLSGPFTKKIFNIISFQNNKLLAKIGDLKTTINSKDFLFRPV